MMNNNEIKANKRRPMSSWTNEDVYEILRNAYNLCSLPEGEFFLIRHYKSVNPSPTYQHLKLVTGQSWGQMCSAAGIPAKSTKKRYSDDEVLEMLRKGKRILGEEFTLESFSELKLGTHGTNISSRFGGWRKACKLAGVSPGDYIRTPIDQLERFKNRLIELGYVPKSTEYTGLPTLATIYKQGLGYLGAVEKVGFNYRESRLQGKLVPLENSDLLKCSDCDNFFTPKNKNQLYCSDRCRWNGNAKLKREKREARGLCTQCGGKMDYLTSEHGKNEHTKHCSKCRKYYVERYESNKNIVRRIKLANQSENNWTGTGLWEGWVIKNDRLVSPTGRAFSPADIEPSKYTQSDLAKALGVTRGAIADRMRRGTLPPFDEDKTWRVDTIKHLFHK